MHFQTRSDYTINYNPVSNACAAVTNRESGAVNRLRQHINNVQRDLTSDNIRRYAQYNIRLSSDTTITPAQRNQRQTDERKIVDDALAKYRTTANDYLAVVNDLAGKIDTTPAMQECQLQAQSALGDNLSSANTLVGISQEICDEFNSILANFETALNSGYRKIGVTSPFI